MSKKICPVILCGGSGTRLWPLSRKSLPKQFVPFFNDKSLLQITLNRFFSKNSLIKFNNASTELADQAICVGSLHHKFLMQDIVAESDASSQFILEPLPRNTSAAMAAACLMADKNHILIFCPSDHFINDVEAYIETVISGSFALEKNAIVALGAQPTFPSTAYGYMDVFKSFDDQHFFNVKEFIEKPDLKKAQQLISSKNVYWNAGSFMAYPETILSSLEKFAPDILNQVKNAYQNGEICNSTLLLEYDSMQKCRSESIDYAVMEKHEDVRMVPLKSAWSDIGSWNALADLFVADSNGNRSSGKAHFVDAKNTFVYSMGREVVAVGTQDLFVVETPDAILVSNISDAEKIREVVNMLEKAEITQAHSHRKVTRPWGVFDSIDQGERFQVKRIIVKPGGRLSLQKHSKRAEHWIVVSGIAKVTKGDDTFELLENESTYIPLGEVHALENPGNTDLELIEVQSGSYLGEDDIVRLEDIYGRS